MTIDLHTHSAVSDGTDAPADLVRKAAEAGIAVLGLTDHDTTDGWAEAQSAADEVGLSLVPGIEISTKRRGRGVHLLAYWPDPQHPALVRLLTEVRAGRDDRVPQMVARLREHGLAITVDDVLLEAAGATSVGRPHIADALIRRGHASSRDQAFDDYLSPGRPGYVDRPAADLDEAIRVVAEAGGVTVIAHPWGRSSAAVMQAADLASLREAGLTGIEVDHRDHAKHERAALRALAGEVGLVATGSSDHHGLGKVDHELACHVTTPEEYERLVEAGRVARARSVGAVGAGGAEVSRDPGPGID